MAQLYFKYGTMNSGKSIEILKVAHNYDEQGKHVLLFTPATDTRDGVGNVSSRIGISKKAIVILPDTNIYNELLVLVKEKPSCILIDEAQFLSKTQIQQLAQIVDNLNIPVMAFGLRTDFKGNLFSGSKALFELADKVDEIKTICWNCEKKASMNLRVIDNKPVYEGEQIQVGGNDSYIPVCRYHYYHYQDNTESGNQYEK